MKPTIITGAVLILIGVLALAYQGFTYTKREKVLEIGPLQATTETEKTVSIPPLVGGLAIVGGVALVALGALK
jgi:dipeptide/tripeptide permease